VLKPLAPTVVSLGP